MARPTSSSVTPIRPASRPIRRRSAAQASTQPPAMAWPLIAATTGFGCEKTVASSELSSGKNAADIGAAALEQAHEVDAGRKDASGSREDDCARGRQSDLLEPRCELAAELDAHGVCLAVGHAQMADLIPAGRFRSRCLLPAPGRRARAYLLACGEATAAGRAREALRVHDCNREDHDRHRLMHQRQRQRTSDGSTSRCRVPPAR